MSTCKFLIRETSLHVLFFSPLRSSFLSQRTIAPAKTGTTTKAQQNISNNNSLWDKYADIKAVKSDHQDAINILLVFYYHYRTPFFLFPPVFFLLKKAGDRPGQYYGLYISPNKKNFFLLFLGECVGCLTVFSDYTMLCNVCYCSPVKNII